MSSCSLMHRVFPPSKPPDGGRPLSLRLIVGGTQLRGSWYLSAIVRLQGFSSCSPAAPLYRRSPKMVTSGLMVGESEPGCGFCPSLSLKDFHHQGWGGECAELISRGLGSGWRPREMVGRGPRGDRPSRLLGPDSRGSPWQRLPGRGDGVVLRKTSDRVAVRG
jgi:hypothetical protein